ncbi:hypothetical protein ACFHYQ_26100 [Sphaerimonospora cavernae]|uniref:Uncharacterized protein n=1 Tax=Sphaerimonospora cavernae TaxID=1740611 RepID=A0ABV6UC53_9ACTN
MRGRVHSQTSHPDHGRSETLSGPADDSSPVNKKTLVIAASALVAVLAAGGVGFAVLSGSDDPARGPAPAAPAASEQAGADQSSADQSSADQPGGEGGDQAQAPGGAGDTEGSGGGGASGGAGTRTDKSGATGDGAASKPRDTGKNRADQNKEGSGSGSTGSAADDAGSPADGPAGLIPGECAKSGC